MQVRVLLEQVRALSLSVMVCHLHVMTHAVIYILCLLRILSGYDISV